MATFSGDTDVDLLGYMALRASDEPAARDAGDEFFKRHGEWLYRRLARASLTRSLNAPHLRDLVQDTMVIAYQRAHTFRAPPGIAADAQMRSIRAWLVRIAANLELKQADHQSKEAAACAEVGLWEVNQTQVTAEETPGAVPDSRLADVEKAVMSLSDRDRDILFTSMQFEKPGMEHQRLPHDVMEELTKRYNTTAVNIRQIRKRAREAIRALLTHGEKSEVQASASGERR